MELYGAGICGEELFLGYMLFLALRIFVEHEKFQLWRSRRG
jgi:hypothetical protein